MHPLTPPGYVTHYHRSVRRPFLNLSELSEAKLASVLAELAASQEQRASSRRFGPRYMALRRATEAHARELFVSRGGRPQRQAPHYFVLGSSAWFAGLYRDVSEVRLTVSDLPALETSFTYTDSITALGLGADIGVPSAAPAHCGRVYRLDELLEVIAHYGMPDDAAPATATGYLGHQTRPVDAYVEVQLWSDTPVRAYLDGS